MSYTATTSTARVKLRTAYGSHAEVARVLAWCKVTGRVSVLLGDTGGGRAIDTLAESELEAIDASDRYVPLADVLKNRAELILR